MRKALVAALCFAAAVCAKSAWSAPAARLETSLGFGGYAVPGRWNPLWIFCDGGPDSSFVQVVRYAEAGIELGRETFPLPPGRRIECPVSLTGELSAIAVRLVSGERTLAESRLDPRGRIFPGNVVLACGIPVRARLGIAAALLPTEPLQAIAVDAGDLPANGLDYDCVGAVALGDTVPALSPAQRSALLWWAAGGGRAAIASGGGLPDSGSPLGPLGPFPGGKGALAAGYSALPLGLGGIARITRDLSSAEGAEASFWRAALSLRPYGSGARLFASAAASWPSATAPADGKSGRTMLLLVAALAAYLAAILACVAKLPRSLARSGKRARDSDGEEGVAASKAWLLVAVSVIAVVLALSGEKSLDRALMRGASAKARALVLPGSGAAVVTMSLRMTSPLLGDMPWTAVKAAVPPPLVYALGAEATRAKARGGGYAEWAHGLPRASFSPLPLEGEDLTVSAVLGPEALALSTFPQAALASRARGDEPPDIDSSGTMVFLSDKDSWWEKRQGQRWERLSEPPSWMASDAQWILGLREAGPAKAFLAGKGAAPSLGLSVAGGPVRDLCWALPIPRGEEG